MRTGAEEVTIKIMECLTVSYSIKQKQIDEVNKLVQDFAKQDAIEFHKWLNDDLDFEEYKELSPDGIIDYEKAYKLYQKHKQR